MTTFILSLTDQQLDDLNIELIRIDPREIEDYRDLNAQFLQTLSAYQINLLKQSRIWTLSKESYLDTSGISKHLTPQQRQRQIQGMSVSPANLLIVEHSPHYDKQLLRNEQETDEVTKT